MLQTVIFGKVNNIKYETKEDTYGRFELIEKKELDHNEEILRFEGEPYYNSELIRYGMFYKYINSLNISEDEEVEEEKKIFRADLNEIHIFTNKVLTETSDEEEKARVEEEVRLAAATFNKEKIEGNEDLKRYCDLHKLSYFDTDAVELADLVYGKSKWEIVDGKVVKVDESKIYISTNATDIVLGDAIASRYAMSFFKTGEEDK